VDEKAELTIQSCFVQIAEYDITLAQLVLELRGIQKVGGCQYSEMGTMRSTALSEIREVAGKKERLKRRLKYLGYKEEVEIEKVSGIL